MLIQIFNPFTSDTDTFQGKKIGDVSDVLSYDYLKKWSEPGNFTIEIPVSAPDAAKIVQDVLLYSDGDMLVVRNVKRDDAKYTITGSDLKTYLEQRITLYSETQDTGTQGYDVCQGTTEYVVKHYVNNNLVNPSDPYRRFARMVIAENSGRGTQNDTYMARLKSVAAVVQELCDSAECGYDITPDFENNNLVFDFCAPVDKTATNIVRDRVVFSRDRGNVLSVTKDDTSDNYRNAFYATKSTGTLESDAVTKLVLRDGANTPGGAYRREINVAVDADSVGEIDTYARHEAENYECSNSYDLDANAIEEYGKVYTIGDVVTIGTDNRTITQVHKQYSAGSRKIALTLGEKKKKPLNVLNEKAEKALYDVKNIVVDSAKNEEVRNQNATTSSLYEQLGMLMANGCGLYQTVQESENGGKVYYLHDQPTLGASTKIWKQTANGYATSNNGGQSWNSGHTVDGNIVANVLEACKIQSPVDANVYFDLLNGKISSNAVHEQGSAQYGDTVFEYILDITAALYHIMSNNNDRVRIENSAVQYSDESPSIKDRGQITLSEDGVQSFMCSRYAYFGRKDDGTFIGWITAREVDAKKLSRNGAWVSFSDDGSRISFGTGGQERGSLDASGWHGIGTTNG